MDNFANGILEISLDDAVDMWITRPDETETGNWLFESPLLLDELLSRLRERRQEIPAAWRSIESAARFHSSTSLVRTPVLSNSAAKRSFVIVRPVR